MTLSRAEVRAAQVAAEKRYRKRRDDDFTDPEDVEGDEGDGRTGWRLWLVRVLKWGTISGLVVTVLGVIGVMIAYNKTPLPDANARMKLQVSIVYYSDGKTEMGRIVADEGNREVLRLAQVPTYVQDAHIAAEDRTFYQNNGISVGGILRAVKTSVTGEAQVGGSTITQQLVKNAYLNPERTLSRKANEILLAIKLDREESKPQILERYLNSIYYGRGAYGIETGAKAYFGKSASKLTVAEGAVLATVINAPSLYDPAEGERAAANLKWRFNYVLNGMVEMNKLSAAERAKITAVPPIKKYTPRKALNGPQGYLMAEVEKELPRVTGLTEQEIQKGGLRIVSTIDKKAQDNAVKAMNENLVKGIQGGLVAIKPGDGAVLAMYGGADYAKRPFNNATQTNVQGGSNFKPFAVLAALREGISTKTRFDGNSPQQFDGIDGKTNNYDHRDYGPVDMRRMIGSSINTAFVALNEEIGPKQTRAAAIDAGIPENTPGLENDLTNVLGTASPRVIDMANAYATIAGQGERAKPYLIKKATSVDGGLDYTAKPEKVRAFPKDVTADTTDAMTYTVKRGGTATNIGRSEFNGGLGDRPVAGKTGTSENNKSKWFSGFVPQIATSVLIYKPSPDGGQSLLELQDSEALEGGYTVPANIWLDFMRPTLDGVEIREFPDRAGIGDDDVKLPPTTTTPPPTSSTPPPTSSTPTQTPPSSTEPTKTPPGKPTETEAEPTITLPTIVTPPPSTSTKPGNG